MSAASSRHDRRPTFRVDNQTIVAATPDTSSFQLFDLAADKITTLATGNFANWILSPDSKFLYFTTGGEDPRARRIRLSDRKIETITSLKSVRRVVDPYFGPQLDWHPTAPFFSVAILAPALDATWR